MKENQVKSIVSVGVFTAITFLGIQIFRIPLPAVIGTPFVHFGHIFVVMGVLLQGGRRGAISGTLGLLIFDLLNGYIHAMPQVFIETILKCLLIGTCMNLLMKRSKGDKKREYYNAVICASIYAILNIVIEFIMGIVNMIILGSHLKAAISGSILSIPATVINAIFMVVIVAFIYAPIKKIYQRTVN